MELQPLGGNLEPILVLSQFMTEIHLDCSVLTLKPYVPFQNRAVMLDIERDTDVSQRMSTSAGFHRNKVEVPRRDVSIHLTLDYVVDSVKRSL